MGWGTILLACCSTSVVRAQQDRATGGILYGPRLNISVIKNVHINQ